MRHSSKYPSHLHAYLVDTVRHKTDQCRRLKLTKLNMARKLIGKMAALNEHKQFVMAVASGRVERVTQLVYNPKGFTEDDIMLGLLILRLGGARLTGILMPSSNSHIAEIEDNIVACAEGEPESSGPPRIMHRVVMLDEIAVEQRPRWDDKTNNILGACRECSNRVSFQLNTAADLEVFFNALDDGDIHLASEATVVAFGVLDKDPRVYSPRPCCISGTDKTETGPEHAKFIQQILTAGYNKRTQRKVGGEGRARDNITHRDICVSSDGEAKRGAALVELTMTRELSLHSPIYPLLIPPTHEFSNHSEWPS
ncbi:hypothetical protein R3P38DRAFT_3332782 [Favolaschia claudopus]|uniref:Uncharacterized protein n=1 Tax=Favolaschia claudopus TaxID=2862362 RepID=A0AAV9ZKG9_9AGAR